MNLTGRWIGETQEKNTERHRWLFVQRGQRLDIYTRWEFEDLWQARFTGDLLENNNLAIACSGEGHQGIVTDSGQVIIYKWLGEQMGEQWVPTYDVVFLRQDNGVKRQVYNFLINALIFAKTVGKTFGLQRVFYDPVILLK
jgi:hypothetical protein